jgi:hypothetical protein
VSIDVASDAWRQLHDAHALVLHADGVTVRMANPFSADETPYRVVADGRHWFANCAWDALGIGAALHVDSHVSTQCSDCGASIEIDVVNGRCSDESLVFHCLVPAVRWWDDIAFT